ncbi:hypothetical protein CAPTEDRAFT_162904 [Capitella teleta]|uniref:Syntaxin-8 n=1 Tax=Capitella teleta TaxID=283909 RepID=R7V1L5_CAPTE|nr:hypothetical protein CAPTEDRAFT_162904 [Capitella teleta]|eukprot:ELU09551.1 hypothetical protein CAPTEDRAFT_162904 [Capitella teleta]
MTDKWLLDYDACARLGQDAMEKINDRNKEPKNSTAYSKQSAAARTTMQKFQHCLNDLRQDLVKSATRNRLTQRETERRQALMDQLASQEQRLDQAFKEGYQATRNSLLGQASAFADDPWSPASRSNDRYAAPNPFEDDPVNPSIDDIRQQQRIAIREQDAGLDALSSIIGRQKQMALDIGNEVDTQNDLIDDITDGVSRTDERLLRETRHIRIVDRKSNVCYMWVVILLLLLIIVIICIVPFGK